MSKPRKPVILAALAAAPAGLSTVDLARLCGGGLVPSKCWSVLIYHERRGRIARTRRGVPGRADTWRITAQGRREAQGAGDGC